MSSEERLGWDSTLRSKWSVQVTILNFLLARTSIITIWWSGLSRSIFVWGAHVHPFSLLCAVWLKVLFAIISNLGVYDSDKSSVIIRVLCHFQLAQCFLLFLLCYVTISIKVQYLYDNVTLSCLKWCRDHCRCLAPFILLCFVKRGIFTRSPYMPCTQLFALYAQLLRSFLPVQKFGTRRKR